MTYLPDLRESLTRAAHRRRELQSHDRIAGSPRRSRTRTWLRAAPGAAAMVIAVAATVAIAGVALTVLGHGRTPSSAPTGRKPSKLAAVVPQQPNVPPADWTYIKNARRSTAAHDPPCSAFVKTLPHLSTGQPSRALTSILGVLRQPATNKPPDLVSHGGIFGSLRDVYINDIRLARTVSGTSFYIIPVGNVTGFRLLPSRCIHAQLTALQTELHNAPVTKRARVLGLQRSYLTWEQYQARHPEGICVAAENGSGSGGVACGSTIADINQGRGGLGADASGTGNTLFHGVVPDGVATVTLRYSPTPASGTAITMSTTVINNVYVIRVPDNSSELPQTTIWRAADGSVIKTIQGTY